MRRFIGWTTGVLAALLLGLLLLLAFPPAGWIASKIEALVSERTGYTLDIGDLELNLLSARPSATLASVTLAGGDLPELLDASHVEVAVDLGAALTGELVIDRAVVDGATVRLIRDADGRTSWTAATVEAAADATEVVIDEATEPDGGELELPTIRSLHVENTTLVWQDALTDSEASLAIEANGSTLPDETPLSIAADGTANGAPMTARLRLESPLQSLISGKAIDIAVGATTEGSALSLHGSVGEWRALNGIDLVLDIDVDTLAGIETALGQPLPPIEGATLDATLLTEGDRVTLTANGQLDDEALRLVFTLKPDGSLVDALGGEIAIAVDLDASLGGAALELAGSIGEPAAFDDVELALAADIDSLAAVEALLGRELPPAAPASLTALLTTTDPGYEAIVDGTVDGEPVSATLDLDATLAEIRAGGPVELALDASVGGAELRLDGRIDDLATLGGADLALDADITSPDALASLTGADLSALEAASLSGTLASDDDGLDLRARGRVNGEAVNASVRLDGTLAELQAGGPAALDVDAELGGVRVDGTARVADLRDLAGADLALDIDVDSLDALAAVTGLELPTIDSADLSTTLATDDGRTVLSATGTVDGEAVRAEVELDTTIDRALAGDPVTIDASARVGGTSVTLDGRVGEPDTLGDVDLALDVDVERLDAIEGLLDIDLPDIEPANLSATLRTDGDDYVVRRFDLDVAGSTLEGDVRVNPSTGPPTLYANVIARRLDADALLDALSGDDDTLNDTAATAEPTDEPTPPTGPVLPADALPIDALFGAVQGAVAIRVDELIFSGAPLASLDGRVTFAPERIDGVLDEASVAGGDVDATLTLERSADGTAVDAKLVAELARVRVGRFVPDVEMVDDLGGPLGGQIEFWASGGSAAALAASLDGGATLLMGRGQLDAMLVELAGLDLFQSIGDLLSPGEDEFRLRCAYASLLADTGVVSLGEVVIDSNDTIFLARGQIDLGNETFDLALEPIAKDPSLVSANSGVAIGGTFAAPSVEVGSELTTRAAAAAALALVATPAAALLPFIELGTGEDSGFCELEGALDGDAG